MELESTTTCSSMPADKSNPECGKSVPRWKTRGRTRGRKSPIRVRAKWIQKAPKYLLINYLIITITLTLLSTNTRLSGAAESASSFVPSFLDSGDFAPFYESLPAELIPASEVALQNQSQLNQFIDYSSSYLDDDEPLVASSADQVLASAEAGAGSFDESLLMQSQRPQQSKSLITRRQVLMSDLSDWSLAQQPTDYDLSLTSSSQFNNAYSSKPNNRVLIADHSLSAQQHSSLSSNQAFKLSSSPSQFISQLTSNQAGQQQYGQQQLQQSGALTTPANIKIGPIFTREPPAFIYYLNSSDLVIPCTASGNPEPTISWWHRNVQLESGSLLDRRYIRYDNSLVISAFKGHEFQQDIHSTVYKCQASNAFGTISSRNVVINAVIDHDFEISVADQFVSADNDALFRCQLSPSTRDFLQVSGWLQDDQLISTTSSLMNLLQTYQAGQMSGPNSKTVSPLQQQQQQHYQPNSMALHSRSIKNVNPQSGAAAVVGGLSQHRTGSSAGTPIQLLDGQLLIPHVHLADANKSYRCQVRNLLNGKQYTSSIGGRLFVTDVEDQSGIAPRLIEAPKQVSVGHPGDSLQLACVAQGLPRPTIRWFKQQPTLQDRNPQASPLSSSSITGSASNSNQIPESTINSGNNDWIELTSSNPSFQLHSNYLQAVDNNNNRIVISTPDANLLLVKSLTISDMGARFRCLANNSYGQQTATTEIRLDLWPPSKLVELEPKIEQVSPISHTRQSIASSSSSMHTTNGHQSLQQPNLTFNCTIRAYASQPLIAIEWLMNGRVMFGISNNYINQPTSSSSSPVNDIDMMNLVHNTNNNSNQNITSLFDLSDDTLEALVNNPETSYGSTSQTPINGEQDVSLTSSSSSASIINFYDGSNVPNNLNDHNNHRQTVRFSTSARDIILYQLHLTSVSKLDRGSYQCRARYLRFVQQATSHLLLKDQAPQFIDSFSSQLIDRNSAHSSTNNNNIMNPFHQQHQSTSSQSLSNSLTTATNGGNGGSSNNNHILHASSISLKCIASGSPLPEISWSLSGFQIPESSRIRVGDYVTRDGLIVSFVNISSIQVDDGGLYECLAKNDAGQAKHSAWLNVTGPPHIRPMSNMNAVAGRNFQIMCPVGGWPIDQISWYQNSTKLPTNHRQKVFPNGTMLISELTEITDSGQYSCQAKTQGQTNDLVALGHLQLTIKVPPVVEPFQFAKSLQRGQRYNVMCTVVRGDLPVSIRWFRDGFLIPEGPFGASAGGATSPTNYNSFADQQQQHHAAPMLLPADQSVAIKQLDPYSSTLTFGSLQSHHRGVYTCEAENEAGRANQSSALVIHVPPEWRIEPRDASITVGRTAVIDCQADAFPAARIEWRLSQDLYRESPSEFKPIISSLYMRVFENGSLIIYNTQRTDAGFYLCQATNGVGPGLSRVIKLTVNVAAHFKTKIRTELVKRGQPAKLRCESIGDPPIDINWLRDKQPLYAAAEPRYMVTRAQLPDGLVSELFIPETERTDSALFTCISQNQFGNDDTNIQLLVQGPPDPPLEIRIADLKSRSVRLAWLAGHSGNSPIQRFVISYALVQQMALVNGAASGSAPGPHLASTPTTYINISVPANETNYVLSQLIPLSEYQFYIIAQNHLGSSPLTSGEILKFRTKDESPSSPLTMVKVQAISSHAVRIKFRSADRRTHYGQPMGVYLGYKQLKPPNSVPNNSIDNQSNAISLDVATTLARSAEAKLSGGGGTSGSTAVAESLGGFVFRTLELSGATSNVNVARSFSGDNNDYLINNQSAATTSIGTNQLDQECLLTGLKRGQRYLITLQPFNSEGTGPASEPFVVETWRIDVPDPPSLRLVLRTSHSIHLAWRLADQQHQQQVESSANAPNNQKQAADVNQLENEIMVPSEPILGFTLIRKQLPNNLEQSEGSSVEMKLPSDHLSQIIDHLQCGTRYQFTIMARNSVGQSSPSEPLTVKTEGSVPVAPDKNSLLSLNSSSLIINLGAWYNGACPMRSFEVLFKQSKSPKWTPLTTYRVGGGNSTTMVPSITNKPGQSAHSPGDLTLVTGTNSNNNNSPNQPTSNADNDTNQSNSNQTIVIANLTPVLNYDIKIIAINDAGSTEAYYTFNTNLGIRSGRPRSINPANDDHAESSSLPETLWGPSDTDYRLNSANGSNNLSDILYATPFVSWLFVCMLMIAASAAICIFLVRRRHMSSSNCSLSLSTTSRTNHSSTNYYETSNKTTTTSTSGTGGSANSASLGQAHNVGPCNGLLHKQLSPADSPPYSNGVRPLTDQHNMDSSRNEHEALQSGNHSAWQHLDLYGRANAAASTGPTQHLRLLNKQSSLDRAGASNGIYGFLRDNQLEDASDLTSVLGGTGSMDGAETMCLGASALNLVGDQALNNCLSNNTNKQRGKYYVSPLIVQAAAANQQQKQLNKLLLSQQTMASKSATLPHNCNQQVVMQHLIGQQQNQNITNDREQHQRLIDSIAAANNLQIQHEQQLNNIQQQQEVHHQHDSMNNTNTNNYIEPTAQNLALLEHQLQHQVYATVKRGCPKVAQFRDYSIYQCPNQTNQQNQNQLIEQQQAVSILRCCGAPEVMKTNGHHSHACMQTQTTNQNPQNQEQQPEQLELDNQQQAAMSNICYMTNGQMVMSSVSQDNQQQQQFVSDYQQLRPQVG